MNELDNLEYAIFGVARWIVANREKARGRKNEVLDQVRKNFSLSRQQAEEAYLHAAAADYGIER